MHIYFFRIKYGLDLYCFWYFCFVPCKHGGTLNAQVEDLLNLKIFV
jgi:hypothetical protein